MFRFLAAAIASAVAQAPSAQDTAAIAHLLGSELDAFRSASIHLVPRFCLDRYPPCLENGDWSDSSSAMEFLIAVAQVADSKLTTELPQNDVCLHLDAFVFPPIFRGDSATVLVKFEGCNDQWVYHEDIVFTFAQRPEGWVFRSRKTTRVS